MRQIKLPNLASSRRLQFMAVRSHHSAQFHVLCMHHHVCSQSSLCHQTLYCCFPGFISASCSLKKSRSNLFVSSGASKVKK